jgi:hypothetical protein
MCHPSSALDVKSYRNVKRAPRLPVAPQIAEIRATRYFLTL